MSDVVAEPLHTLFNILHLILDAVLIFEQIFELEMLKYFENDLPLLL